MMIENLYFKNEAHRKEFEKNIYNAGDTYYLTAIYLLSSLGKNFKNTWYKDPADNYIEFEKMFKNTDFSSTQRMLFALAVEMYNESHFLISDEVVSEDKEKGQKTIIPAVCTKFSIFDLAYFDEENIRVFLQALSLKNKIISHKIKEF